MQTVRQHQEGGRWTSTKIIMIKDWEIDKYTYLRGKFLLGSKYASIPYMTYLSKNVRQHKKVV